jgi:uncharacterized protein YbjT (DUF2867 family)
MNLEPLNVLVTGATGNQGGAVARNLLARGHHVRALTRNSNSRKAKEIEDLGAELFEGDFDYVISLQKAMEGMDAVYAMSTPFEKGTNFEQKTGYLLELAANTTGIKHFIYSSVGSADQNTGIPHFDSKYDIEKHLQVTNTPFTVIRPVFFMENYSAPWSLPDLREGKISMAISKDRKLQMVGLEDLANMVVYIFENRNDFLMKTIEIASDEKTGEEVAEILSEVTGTHIEYNELSYEDINYMPDDFIKTYVWMNEVGYRVDIPKLHREHSEVVWHTFEEWARKQYWRLEKHPVEQEVI